MNEYINSIIFVSFCIAVFSFLLYKENERSARLAFGILLCYVTLFPLIKLPSVDVSGIISGIQGGIESGEHIYREDAKEAFEEGISAAVSAEFSLDAGEVRAVLHGFDFQNMSAESVQILLSGKSAFSNIEKIKKYVSELGLGDCEVLIEL